MVLVIVVSLNALGAVVLAVHYGMFDRERLALAWQALRGDPLQPAPVPAAAVAVTSAPASQPQEVRPATTTTRPLADDRVVADLEIVRAQLAQREADIRNQWSMISAARLQVLRDREAFEQEKKSPKSSPREPESPVASVGYAKELEYLGSIRPKQAKDFLRLKKDADVVQILIALEPRVGRKIIDACRSEEDRLWMGRILEQLRHRNGDQAEALATNAK